MLPLGGLSLSTYAAVKVVSKCALWERGLVRLHGF